MIIIDRLNSKEWDGFVSRHSLDGGFLQSWQWGELQKSLGRKIWRLGLMHDDELVAVALAVKLLLPLGFSYFYTPRGPVVKILENIKLKAILNELEEQVSRLAQAERAVFWRVEPAWPSELVSNYLFSEAGFFRAVSEVQPLHTMVLDLALSEQELLKKMKPKTRYNIGLAQKHGVTVREGQNLDDLKIFYQLLLKTTERQDFRTHSFKYFQTIWQVLAAAGQLKLFLADYQGQSVGAILVSSFGQTASYLHGGTSDQFRQVMAPYLLHWQAILQAKRAGLKRYDFWGVAAADQAKQTAKEKNWQGISRFKTGFAPEQKIIEYLGSFEKAYRSAMYKIYRKFKQWRSRGAAKITNRSNGPYFRQNS